MVVGSPSSTLAGVPPWHWPCALQVWPLLHTSLLVHEVPAGTRLCVIAPVDESQTSAVHGLPSSSTGGIPAAQVPAALHVSLPLHAFPSEHELPAATGECAIPVAGSQLSVVHGLLSSIAGAVPAIQVPEPLQTSLPLQTLASAQEVPVAAGVCVTPATESQLSDVHGLLSSTGTAEPGVQVPAWQASPAVHALLSLHSVPLGAMGLEQAPVLGSQVPAR